MAVIEIKTAYRPGLLSASLLGKDLKGKKNEEEKPKDEKTAKALKVTQPVVGVAEKTALGKKGKGGKQGKESKVTKRAAEEKDADEGEKNTQAEDTAKSGKESEEGAAETDAAEKKRKRKRKADYVKEGIPMKKKSKSTDDDKERLERTLFVGSIASNSTGKQLKSHFKSYGEIESVRFRSFGVAEAKIDKKLAYIQQKMHKERNSMNAYVVFKNKGDCEKALKENGSVFNGRHIRCDLAGDGKTKCNFENANSIFIGNIPLNCDEEQVWEFFGAFGAIEGVRLVRDEKLGIGKGFGFVAYKEKESVVVALKAHETEFLGRKVRVFRSLDASRLKKKADKVKQKSFQGLKTSKSDNSKFVKSLKRDGPKKKGGYQKTPAQLAKTKAMKKAKRAARRMQRNESCIFIK